MSIKVIAHIAPDSDATCSPIAYAWYLKEKKGIDATAYIAGNLNKETEFILNHFDIAIPPILEKFESGDQVVLMDTNNPDELVNGIENAQIIEIIDHHKLFGGLSTDSPVKVTMIPLACTATIVWKIMKAEGNTDIDKNIAGVMLSAILSDTLKFTSPTTTDEDRNAATELATICGEGIETLASAMFSAKSNLTGMSPTDILTVDSKIFEMNNNRVRVSVLETTNPEIALGMKDDLIGGMDKLKTDENLDGIFFFVVDILNTEATLIVTNDKEKDIAQKAFGQVFDNSILKLPGVVSRKKQIVPKLEEAYGLSK